MESVALRQAAALVLHRHGLTERRPLARARRVVSDVCGINAQNLAAAFQSFWCRIDGVDEDRVAREVFESRQYARTWCVRGTIHIVTAEELPVYIQACARPHMETWEPWARVREPTLTPTVVAHMMDRLAAVLEQGPRTMKELSHLLGPRLPKPKGRGREWALWALVRIACSRGLCLPADRVGAENVFALTKQWLKVDVEDVSREQARARLVHAYMRGYGPASVSDLAYWAGWRVPEARAALAAIEDDLVQVSVGDRGPLVALASDADRWTDEPELPPRLLPRFDSLLLGHRDKSRFMDESVRKAVFGAAGTVYPSILVDGGIEGLWRHDWEGRTLRVTLRPFRPLAAPVARSLREEAEDLARFLDARRVDVQFSR